MEISFSSNKLEKIFSSGRELVRVYGGDRGKKLQRIISFLMATPSLQDVPTDKPFRRHELTQNRKGQFAIDITKNWRLLLEPSNNPLPLYEDGGLNLEKIDQIKILNVEDYHGD